MPAEIADPQPPRPLEVVELAEQPLAHLHPFHRADVRGEDAERLLFEPEGFVDDPDAVAQRRADDREDGLLAAGDVARPGPRSGRVEDGEPERVAVAAIGLHQLFEPAAHVPGLVEAGQFLEVLFDRCWSGSRRHRAVRDRWRRRGGRLRDLHRRRGHGAELAREPLRRSDEIPSTGADLIVQTAEKIGV